VVQVVNPGPGGGASNTLGFDVADLGTNPPPTITALDPPHSLAQGAGADPLVVRVLGQDFVVGAQAQWNGLDRPTQYVSPTEVRVTLMGLEVALGGAGQITVINPAPGGGASNGATFVIFPYGIRIPFMRR
jgi:hypothetical protein